MGETRVDLHHLLEDLRDAYPGGLEETIVTEVVANSLDSGATGMRFLAEPAASTLTIIDNGSGMRRRDLVRYHDLASSTKSRGQGIGFAGVGIKLGLLICSEVVTETKRNNEHIASRWFLAGRHKAPWKWTPPLGLVTDHGTAVQLRLHNSLSPLLDEGYLDGVLRRQFQPLLDPEFDDVLAQHYPAGFRFEVNNRPLDRSAVGAVQATASGTPAAIDVAKLAICLGRKRKPSATGYLVRRPADVPFPDDQRGIAISTFGKVIKRGWDWLGVSPATPDRISGLVEAPALAEALTLNKGDFIRTGPRGALYLSYRKAIQEMVAQQLAQWGDARDSDDKATRKVIRPLERDVESVLLELADEYPLLASLVEQRIGGQRKLSFTRRGTVETGQDLVAAAVLHTAIAPETSQVPPVEPRPETTGPDPESVRPNSADPPSEAAVPAASSGEKSRARPGHYGLSIRFESLRGDPELGRLIESTVVINEAHPAYRRAVASRSDGYHIALAVALALARLAVPPAEEHEFVTAFLTYWGEALDPSRTKRPRRG